MRTLKKVYDCLVCETGEVRTFSFRSDADKFVSQQTARGNHVLRGIAWVAD